MYLRLSIILILRGNTRGFLTMIAMCCSSFVAASRGTTQRSVLTPMGQVAYKSVQVANFLASRPGWVKFERFNGFGFIVISSELHV